MSHTTKSAHSVAADIPIASSVSVPEHESGKSSYGVVPPVAVLVDLDRVRSGPLSFASCPAHPGRPPAA